MAETYATETNSPRMENTLPGKTFRKINFFANTRVRQEIKIGLKSEPLIRDETSRKS